MRKHRISWIFVITLVFAAFTIGFFLGKTQDRDEISVSVPAGFMTMPAAQPEQETSLPQETREVTFPISINSAQKEELMALPGIGEILAERILAYREEIGSFSAPEDLLNVEGIGKKRLEEILNLITIGG